MALKNVKDTFTRWAPYYDATHAWTLPLRRQARLTLDLCAGDKVLDLACGTGVNFSHLHSLVGGRGQVTGVDLVPAMLVIANQRIQRHGWSNVETRQADAAHLPFQNVTFDRVICTFALNIIPDYVSAVAEIERVLKPGGLFVSLEMSSMMHTIPRRLKPLQGICAVDMNHETIGALRQFFGDVRVVSYFLGLFFIASMEKQV